MAQTNERTPDPKAKASTTGATQSTGELDIFSEEYLGFATLLKQQEPELWRELYDRRLMPKLCNVHAKLIRKEAYRLASEVIGEDESDTTKDAYSTSALVKDGRNSLRAEQRRRLQSLIQEDAE